MKEIRTIMYNPLTPMVSFLLALAAEAALSFLGASLLSAMLFGVLTLITIVSAVINYRTYEAWLRSLIMVMCLVMVAFYMVNLIQVTEPSVETTVQAPAESEAGSSQGASGGHTGSTGSGSHQGGESQYHPGDDSNYHPGDDSNYHPDDDSNYHPDDDSHYHPEEDPECYFCQGTDKCHVCNGKGGQRCTGCYSGRCKYCNGSGVSSGYGVQSKCGGCGGDGECNICDGTGIRDCNICYGRGTCTHC